MLSQRQTMNKKHFIGFIFTLIFQLVCFSQISSLDSIALKIKEKKRKIKNFNSVNLGKTLQETSGLLEWNNDFYTHNDDRDVHFYQVDKKGEILKSIELKGIQNKDWEAIAQDENYFYLGDIGNNVSGNRRDLCIYKIEKKSLFNNPKIEKIFFSYAKQTDFGNQKSNQTDFDCETIVVTENGLFLFTKQWKSKKTAVYFLPKIAGTHQAEYLTTLPVKGLITDATYLANQNLIVLCGYSKTLKPFLYVLNSFTDFTFQNAIKRKIKLKLPFHQIEGISTTNGIDFYLTNETFKHKIIGTIPAQLHSFSIK